MKRHLTTIRELIDDNGIVCDTLYECAMYMIDLHSQAGWIYELTKLKLGELLSIVAFRYYIKEKTKLFDCDIYVYENCVPHIRMLNRYIDIVSDYGGGFFHCVRVISEEELNKKSDVLEAAKAYSHLTDEIKKDVKEVFLNFAAYPKVALKELLYPIVAYEGVCSKDQIIDLDAVAQLDLKKFPDNKVLNYIFNR
jgi:hypothetical protein